MRYDETLKAEEPVGVTRPAARNAPASILVADDDGIIRHLNTTLLVDAGYLVDSAEDGAAAWDILQTKQFHLLVTDHNMPRLSGFELIQKVSAARIALPVIMVSATLPVYEFIRFPELRPAAMVQKPYRKAELLNAVREVLSTDRSSQV